MQVNLDTDNSEIQCLKDQIVSLNDLVFEQDNKIKSLSENVKLLMKKY